MPMYIVRYSGPTEESDLVTYLFAHTKEAALYRWKLYHPDLDYIYIEEDKEGIKEDAE